MNESAPLTVPRLLALLFAYQQQQEDACERAIDARAAKRAACQKGLTPAQEQLLEKVRQGKMTSDQLRQKDLGAYRLLMLRRGVAADVLNRYNARKADKTRFFKPSLWEFVVSEVNKVASVPLDAKRLAEYAGQVNLNTVTSDEASAEIARLDAEGRTPKLIMALRQEYPDESAAMGLPKELDLAAPALAQAAPTPPAGTGNTQETTKEQPGADVAPPVLHEDSLAILRFLDKRNTYTKQVTIATEVGRDEATVRSRLKELRGHNFTQSYGRTGEAITPAGREHLKSHPG